MTAVLHEGETFANALVSLPVDVIVHGSRIISIDGDSNSATCDLCHLLWAARTLAFRGSIYTFECCLCTSDPCYVVFIDSNPDPALFVAEADALAYADHMVNQGHRVYTDAATIATVTSEINDAVADHLRECALELRGGTQPETRSCVNPTSSLFDSLPGA